MKARQTRRASPRHKRIPLAAHPWWELAFSAIGALSFIAILVVLFLPLGKGPSNFTYTGTPPPVSSPKFVRLIADTMSAPLKQGGTIEPLENGDAFLKAFLADIDAAKSSIDIMVYIWTDGKMSDQVLDRLDRKLKEGVQVRIMVDSYGSSWEVAPRKRFKASRQLGAKIEEFNSLTIAPWDFLKNTVRNHRRAMIVDGRIGYTGGTAISDPWLGDARNKKEYRDLMFRVTGPMVHDLQGVFAELWSSMTGEVLVGDAFFPEPTGQERGQGRGPTYVPLARVPSPDSLALQKFVLLSILAAEKTVHITSPYFLPDRSLREALIKKAQAGVDVRVLAPNELNDSKAVHHASHDTYDELLSGGVKIYEYQPTFIHTKAMIVDGTWSIIGSANMDNRSRKINQEVIVGIADAAFGARMEEIFAADLSRAKQIELTEWRKRGLWPRIREFWDRHFVEQY